MVLITIILVNDVVNTIVIMVVVMLTVFFIDVIVIMSCHHTVIIFVKCPSLSMRTTQSSSPLLRLRCNNSCHTLDGASCASASGARIVDLAERCFPVLYDAIGEDYSCDDCDGRLAALASENRRLFVQT